MYEAEERLRDAGRHQQESGKCTGLRQVDVQARDENREQGEEQRAALESMTRWPSVSSSHSRQRSPNSDAGVEASPAVRGAGRAQGACSTARTAQGDHQLNRATIPHRPLIRGR